MEVASVLVAMEHDGGSVGVVRDRDGLAWLSDSTERIDGAPLVDIDGAPLVDYAFEYLPLTDDRTLVGGLLASGAVSAEIVDELGERHAAATANGAYVALLQHGVGDEPPLVCCRDASGMPVAPGLPADWARTPVFDAEEPCPACRAVAWDEVRPTDDSRGSHGVPGGKMEPTPIVVCRSCGHEESIGTWLTYTAQPDRVPEAVTRELGEREDARRQRLRTLLAQLDFAIYADEGRSVSVAAYGVSSAVLDDLVRLDRITVAQPADPGNLDSNLLIETAARLAGSDQELARSRLESWLRDEIPLAGFERSDAGRAVAWHSADRERRKLVGRARASERSVSIGGEPEAFAFLEVGARWVAVRHHGAVTITLSGNRVDPRALSLEPLQHPVEDLFGEDD